MMLILALHGAARLHNCVLKKKQMKKSVPTSYRLPSCYSSDEKRSHWRLWVKGVANPLTNVNQCRLPEINYVT